MEIGEIPRNASIGGPGADAIPMWIGFGHELESLKAKCRTGKMSKDELWEQVTLFDIESESIA